MNSKTHAGSLAKGATPGRGSSWSPELAMEEKTPEAAGRGGGAACHAPGDEAATRTGFSPET